MTNTPEPIRVLIVDDHQIVREGIIRIISRHPDITVVAEASNGRQAVELFGIHHPDVCVIDLRMPQLGGMDTITEILRMAANAKIIILSAYDGEDDVYKALQIGAMSYVVKDVIEQDLVATIRSVADGQKLVNPEIATKLLERLSKPDLTERELEVITLLVRGRSNREIAIHLGITEGTVKVHLNNLYTKLGVRDRAGASSTAIQRGIVQMD
jgi:two-component system NarL family response regulator